MFNSFLNQKSKHLKNKMYHNVLYLAERLRLATIREKEIQEI